MTVSTTGSRGNSGNWSDELLAHLRAHRTMAVGLLAALLLVLWQMGQTLLLLLQGQGDVYVIYALLGGAAGFAGTALGAMPALFLRQVPQQAEDMMLGFAAGMMLAASAFSLILPGIEAGTELFASNLLGGLCVVAGITVGVMLMLGMDQFIPHEHDKTGPCGPGHERCGRVWLFVFAIALHNLPEGMAVGVSFSQGDISVGLPLASAIALQDIPEGLAVALTLCAAGFPRTYAVMVAVATGLLEPLGALLGVGLGGGLLFSYPLGLGIAAGAMLFVVSHEVIPETHRNGHQTLATIGLMIGFCLMMLLDTCLG